MLVLLAPDMVSPKSQVQNSMNSPPPNDISVNCVGVVQEPVVLVNWATGNESIVTSLYIVVLQPLVSSAISSTIYVAGLGNI